MSLYNGYARPMTHWQDIGGAFLCTYTIGAGPLQALALPLPQGAVAVVSPPVKPGAGMLEDLRRVGEVRALIAPNFFHHLGIPQWSEHFPEARVFAPERAIRRLRKKCPVSREIEPVAALKLLPNVRVAEIPQAKNGESIVMFEGGNGWNWFITDLVLNLEKAPDNWILKLVVALMNGGTGFRPNRFVKTFLLKDKPAFKAWMKAEIASHPPRRLFFAHGRTLEDEDIAERWGTLIETMF